jgi:hypothetical protein
MEPFYQYFLHAILDVQLNIDFELAIEFELNRTFSWTWVCTSAGTEDREFMVGYTRVCLWLDRTIKQVVFDQFRVIAPVHFTTRKSKIACRKHITSVL